MPDHANIHSVTFGTGHQIYTSTILPAIEKARKEVILVTCFWAASSTRDALNSTLLKLNTTAIERGHRVKVRIGFSSSSLSQKLFHTSSPAGHTYSPLEWSTRLGLPPPDQLRGLDFEIKSIFFLPFSVWHPKFVIVDNRRVFLPSCNVSWEDWFEGCVELSGPIIGRFTQFWQDSWANDVALHHLHEFSFEANQRGSWVMDHVECAFLPSPHHRNPRWRLPWQESAPPPDTPLNSELLALLRGAGKEIYLQTPNVTCAPVLDALKDALSRGVNVRIVTSEGLMTLEQLVTAGTTTRRCIRHLIQQYENIQPGDEEAARPRMGQLHISYYIPRSPVQHEPVQSHLKLTIIDGSVIIFGSGNMDRASWYTSQELGVAFYSEELCARTLHALQYELKGRTKLIYES
jgi:phosphatidylserine/phosphatidylglycerophosphate/cardiolipin synthase-like enzyme